MVADVELYASSAHSEANSRTIPWIPCGSHSAIGLAVSNAKSFSSLSDTNVDLGVAGISPAFAPVPAGYCCLVRFLCSIVAMGGNDSRKAVCWHTRSPAGWCTRGLLIIHPTDTFSSKEGINATSPSAGYESVVAGNRRSPGVIDTAARSYYLHSPCTCSSADVLPMSTAFVQCPSELLSECRRPDAGPSRIHRTWNQGRQPTHVTTNH